MRLAPAIFFIIAPIAVAQGQVYSCTVTTASIKEPMLVTSEMRDKQLVQTWATGIKNTYEIVQNNFYGLVAVSTISEIVPGQTKPTVGVCGVAIDRKTHEIWITTIVIGMPPAANEPAHGNCLFTWPQTVHSSYPSGGSALGRVLMSPRQQIRQS